MVGYKVGFIMLPTTVLHMLRGWKWPLRYKWVMIWRTYTLETSGMNAMGSYDNAPKKEYDYNTAIHPVEWGHHDDENYGHVRCLQLSCKKQGQQSRLKVEVDQKQRRNTLHPKQNSLHMWMKLHLLLWTAQSNSIRHLASIINLFCHPNCTTCTCLWPHHLCPLFVQINCLQPASS